ncbi:MAG TPA: phospholipase [Bacteroidia bacterium]|nr:phospholipase [Bacteroidia bacterium]
MIAKKITVPKTARYFGSANPSPEFTEVVFVCHGYAQLANTFIENFSGVANERRLIIAPEGLHRFYQRGGYDHVVASWMTKEDRHDDIRDYITWLDFAAADVLMHCRPDIKVTVLGFSQGAATVSRWSVLGMTKIHHLILWCGFFPPDLPAENKPKCENLTVVTASDDKYVDAASEEKNLREMKAVFTTYKHVRFTGGHEIHAGTLCEVLEDKP